jgi:molecular chaperone GrpE
MTSTESRVTDPGDPPVAEPRTSDPGGPRQRTEPGDELGARLAAVEAGLAAVLEQLTDAAARAAARERVIDRQHAEIERLRSAERGGLLRPVVTDLSRLRNDLLRQAARTPDAGGGQLRALLRSYADDVGDALERCGVVALPDPTGGPAEPARHHVAGVAPTTDEQRAGTVAELLADGYLETDTGRVVVPARVTVYRCEGATHD